MATLLITGSGGFIGRNLLHVAGSYSEHAIIAVSRKATAAFAHETNTARIERITSDLNAPYPPEFLRTLSRCDAVIHCAWEISFSDRNAGQRSLDATISLAAAAKRAGVKRFLFVSACAVFGVGASETMVLDEGYYDRPQGSFASSPYAQGKRETENRLREMQSECFQVLVAYPTTVYGAGDDARNSGSLVKLALLTPVTVLPPGGTSGIGVVDLCHGLVRYATFAHPPERLIFNAFNAPFATLFADIQEAGGKVRPRLSLSLSPRLLAPLAKLAALAEHRLGHLHPLCSGEIIASLSQAKYYNGYRATKALSYDPQSYGMRKSLSDACNYYRAQGFL